MRIRSKLLLLMLLNSILLVVTMYLLIQWTVDKELIKYINIREQKTFSAMSTSLGERYDAEGSWFFLKHQPHTFHQILRQSGVGTVEHRPPPPERRGAFPSHLPPRERRQVGGIQDKRPVRRPPPKNELDFALLNSEKERVVGRYRLDGNYGLTAIKSGSETVGWLAFKRKRNPGDDFDFALQESLTEGVFLVSGLVLFLSILFSIPLTRLIVRRVKALTDGAKAVSKGDLKHRVVAKSKDEIGELGRDFNHLAQTLEQNESARKRWIADISHELRTPLAITSGELEAMEDGVRPLNIENIKSARDEIKHLQRLVNDLYELTNADIGAISYHKLPVDLVQFIQSEGENFALLAGEHDIEVGIHLPRGALTVEADTGRLKQLVQNILGNSIKYTDAPGKINISLKVCKKEKLPTVELMIEDSSPGVDEAHFPKLFDHLYRVEASRNRKTGGSGLGLAMCKKIVLAHQGTVTASASQLGGLKVSIRFPLSLTNNNGFQF